MPRGSWKKSRHMDKATFQHTCVSCSGSRLRELEHIIDHERSVTFETFKRNVDEVPEYSVALKDDYAVSFHKSRLPNGKRVYYYVHSAIEHIYY